MSNLVTLTHPKSDRRVEVPGDQVSMYRSQGWVPNVTTTPPGNASLEVWQEYAATQGASAEDIDGASRDDLRDRYGK